MIAPQLPQNLASEGFSALHLGHGRVVLPTGDSFIASLPAQGVMNERFARNCNRQGSPKYSSPVAPARPNPLAAKPNEPLIQGRPIARFRPAVKNSGPRAMQNASRRLKTGRRGSEIHRVLLQHRLTARNTARVGSQNNPLILATQETALKDPMKSLA